MMDNDLRLDILRQVEAGELSMDKASELLSKLEQSKKIDQQNDQNENVFETNAEVINNHAEIKQLSKEDLKKPAWGFVFWLIPILFGALITVTSTSWLYQSYTGSGLSFRFWMSWIPFLIGIGLIYFGFVLQQARWLYIHIRQPKGEKLSRIIIGFPVPFRFLISILNIFRHKLPEQAQIIDLDMILSVIDENISSEDPLVINVDDDDGSKVEIYFG